MVQWFKKYDLYGILIIFILGMVILLISWFHYVELRDFLIFIASILIATSSYMILLINSIKQRKREEKRKKKEAIRKRKRKIRRIKRVYKAIRDLILSLQKRTYERSISPSSISSPIDVFLGGRIFDLSKKKKYLKLLNCRIEDTKLFYSNDYVIDAYCVLIEYKGDYITDNQEKINILLEDLEKTFEIAKNKLAKLFQFSY